MTSKLINPAPFEAQSTFEQSLTNAFLQLETTLRPPFPLSISNSQQYSSLNEAILFGVLTEPNFSKIHIKHLHGIVNDGYGLYTSLNTRLVNKLYERLLQSVKIQLLWSVKQIIAVLGLGYSGLIVSLLRRIYAGDMRDENLWLSYELTNLLLQNFDSFLEDEPAILSYGLYVFLRILSDHCRFTGDSKLENLKNLEIEFCTKVIKEQFHLCLKLGRDFVRLLQDLFHVPQFRSIWGDLINSPSNLKTPNFFDISQLYCARTSSSYHLLRITPEMEEQLRFMMMHVKFGNHQRHQIWFARKFLADAGRRSSIVDIVRFICCGHHPTNETLQSDVVPRWAIIGWLLQICDKHYVLSNAKLALFYDWLFFDGRVDNIMNIEPAMLLIVFSLPKHLDMAHSLLEFLLLVAENYDVERKGIVRKGLVSGFDALVAKQVVVSLNVLFSCSFLSPAIKERLQKLLFGSM